MAKVTQGDDHFTAHELCKVALRSGRLPGAPTDPGVHVKCTRFVTLWHVAVPHTTWSFRGDTLVRHGVLGVVPTPRPQRGTPFAPRGPEGPFPRFTATMGHCDFLTAFSPRFVSFAWRYLGAPAFRPRRPQTHGRRIIPEFAVPVAPDPVFFKETARISHVPVKPVRSFAMFLRPRCDQAAPLGQGQACLARPPRLSKTRAHDKVISGLNHTAFDLAVYASQRRSPAPTQDSLPGCWPSSAGRDWLPAGFQ